MSLRQRQMASELMSMYRSNEVPTEELAKMSRRRFCAMYFKSVISSIGVGLLILLVYKDDNINTLLERMLNITAAAVIPS